MSDIEVKLLAKPSAVLTITRVLPTMPPAERMVNIVMNELVLEMVGFQRQIMGMSARELSSAQSVIIHISNVIWQNE